MRTASDLRDRTAVGESYVKIYRPTVGKLGLVSSGRSTASPGASPHSTGPDSCAPKYPPAPPVPKIAMRILKFLHKSAKAVDQRIDTGETESPPQRRKRQHGAEGALGESSQPIPGTNW